MKAQSTCSAHPWPARAIRPTLDSLTLLNKGGNEEAWNDVYECQTPDHSGRHEPRKRRQLSDRGLEGRPRKLRLKSRLEDTRLVTSDKLVIIARLSAAGILQVMELHNFSTAPASREPQL